MKIILIKVFFWCFCLLISCNSSKNINRDFNYFQRGLDSIAVVQLKESVIHKNDFINIQVFNNSLNQDEIKLFNLPADRATSDNLDYLVEMDGTIDMPIIGKTRVEGLTINQVRKNLLEKLSSYIKNPSVLIRPQQLKINVLGEVKTPGKHNFPTNQVTLIDAISAAGDLTDYGRRENIMVIREENSSRKYYRVDLRSGSLFTSPVYQLEPNDIVYVSANQVKLKMVNSTQGNQRGIQIFLGITSVLTSLILLLTNNR